MKNWIIFLLLAGLLAPAAFGAESVQIDGVAAWVNGTPITIMEVLREAQPQFGSLQREQGLSRAELFQRRVDIFNQTRKKLVDAELIYAWYQKEKQNAKESITDQMVDSRINDIVQVEFQGSREKLMQELARDRQTYEEWRSKMAKRFVVQSIRSQEVLSKVQVLPEQVRAYYETNRAAFNHPGQVLLRRIVLTGLRAETRSQEVLEQLSKGEDFAALARAIGKDPSGGLWGWRDEAELSPILREKLAIMRLGGVCRINLQGDWYLVKLEARHSVPFEDAVFDIEDKLRENRAEELSKLWMARLERDFDANYIDQPIFDE
jgi:parvulin-like peptidyl-prolyl isomerase